MNIAANSMMKFFEDVVAPVQKGYRKFYEDIDKARDVFRFESKYGSIGEAILEAWGALRPTTKGVIGAITVAGIGLSSWGLSSLLSDEDIEIIESTMLSQTDEHGIKGFS